MVVADLHVHTTVSDGQLQPSEVPDAATRAGVRVVALTDHDRLNPALERPITHVDGVTLIHGIELRVEGNEDRIDLLGYGVTPTDALRAECNRLQDDRIERAEAIIDRIEEYTGTRLDYTPERGAGRPDIARAIGRSDIEYDYHGAFEHLIGNGRPCYVPRRVPSFERGKDLLEEACGLMSLAHPLRYTDPEAELSLASDLDSVEYRYEYGHDVDLRPVERAIREHDLIITGGSDAHDRTVGHTGLGRDDYRTFRSRLDLPHRDS